MNVDAAQPPALHRQRADCDIHVVGHLVFFFFQAEDGIRDLTVTGVQTCALPISVTKISLNEVAAAVARGQGIARSKTASANVSGASWGRLRPASGTWWRGHEGGLASQEGKQVSVEPVLMGVHQAVRCARIVDLLDALDELGRFMR